MAQDWIVDAQLQAADFNIVLMTHGATGPLTRTHRMPDPTISLFLSRDYGEAAGCYQLGGTRGHFTRFGKLTIVPAEIPLSVRASGAPPRRLISCRFERARFRLATGFGEDWADRELAACLDVRNGQIEAGLRLLAREAATPGFASELLVEGIGITLMAEIARYLHGAGDRSPPVKGGLAPWQMRRITDRVEARPEAPPGLAELALLCGIGRRHLMRAFKHGTGRTITDYVAGARLERAMRLLSDTELPLGDIARRLGFAGSSGFCHAFRRATGEAPSAFRRRGRGG